MLAISWSAVVTTHSISVSHQASHMHSIAPSVKNLWNFIVLMVPSQSPVKNMSRSATTSLACWLWLGWNQKMKPSCIYILLTAWNSLQVGWTGSGIFIIICWRFACVCLSIKSNVAGSHVEHVSICDKNRAWWALRLAAFALAWVFVSSWWLQMSLILKPREKL